ncbi:hypothetical protein AGMMS49593_00720 [Endomicrobiia bacterium]|nr:hypothetical protein AGMMS49593_00720 [Endomicrobiia bacterium]
MHITASILISVIRIGSKFTPPIKLSDNPKFFINKKDMSEVGLSIRILLSV